MTNIGRYFLTMKCGRLARQIKPTRSVISTKIHFDAKKFIKIHFLHQNYKLFHWPERDGRAREKEREEK